MSVTGTVGRGDGRLDQRQRVVEVAHQRRTGIAAGHLARGAAHVDVDDVGAGVGRGARALRHPAGFAPGELDDVRPGAGPLRPHHRAACRRAPAGRWPPSPTRPCPRPTPRASSRNGRSEMPDIGARKTRFASTTGPTERGRARDAITGLLCIANRHSTVLPIYSSFRCSEQVRKHKSCYEARQ